MKNEECEEYAATFGGTWTPTPWQGMNSYTLRNETGTAISQFRDATEGSERFDLDDVLLAKEVHPVLAPQTTCLGLLPTDPSVCIWHMECLPGDPYLFHCQTLSAQQVSTAISDLARFFAEAWRRAQRDTTQKRDLQGRKYRAALSELLVALPTRFSHIIQAVTANVDIILTLPQVLTHSDLSSGNILIDPQTGHITGVVDWAEASIEPFGIALWGLHSLLGWHGSAGYSWVHDEESNRQLFRDVLLQQMGFDGSVEVLEWARLLGVLLRYGFVWDVDAGGRMPPTQVDDLAFLAICLDSYVFCDGQTLGLDRIGAPET